MTGDQRVESAAAPLDGLVIDPSPSVIDEAAAIICGHDLIYKSLDQETAGNFHMFVQEVLETTVGEELRRLVAERRKLDRRIHNQRVALRSNWEIIEKRAQYRKAWYRSPLLTSILIKSTWNRRQPWWRRTLAALLQSCTTTAR